MDCQHSLEIFCYFHMGGQIINQSGVLHYDGGITMGKMIEYGLSLTELVSMLSSCFGEDINGKRLKYSLKFDPSQLINLIDDDGVKQLIKHNERSAHLFIVDDDQSRTTISQSTQGVEASQGRSQFSSTPSENISALAHASQSVPTLIPELNSSKWSELIVGSGQIFYDADDFRKALYKYSIAHKFGYKFLRNSPNKMIVQCNVDGCKWKITAYAMTNGTPRLRVTTFNKEHEHSTQDTLQVSHMNMSDLVASIIVDHVRNIRDKEPNDIRRDLFQEYGVSLSYHQAWRAKERAMNNINRSIYESYMLIPWLCNRLMEADPQTVVKWDSSVNNHFERLFIAYGCSITGFLLGCRPILYIDGCHLSRPYLGTLLAASTYDANNDLYPFAYAIVNGETYEDWSWFLRNVKELVGHAQITIVSDRHNAIIGAVREVFGGSRHAFCYRHIKENFSIEFSKVCRGQHEGSKEDALKLLDIIAYSRSDTDFVKAMGKLRSLSPELTRWVETQSDINKWAMSRFPFRRWDNIITNLEESFNAWLVKERRDNICVLVNEHRQKLAKKLYAAKEAMRKWKNGVGPKIEAMLNENVAQAENMTVEFYSTTRMHVQVGRADFRVNVALRECTCHAWQMSGIPCPHACAAIKKLHGNIYTYVEECYLLSSQEKIYMNAMIPVETHDMPNLNRLHFEDYMKNIFLQPPITSRPPGRPKNTHRESQFQDKVQYQCSCCHQFGHNRASCKNPNPTEP